MAAPTDRRYTRTHEWVLVEGDVATMGVTDHAQNELGDITYLELPDPGTEVEATKPLGVVESVKAASDVYSPVDGEIVERNDAILDSPEVVNSSPYEGAWLVKIRLANPAQVEDLMDADAYDVYEKESAV
ncbi:MAG: Glycine cleavage system H protein [uncultured Thermomicrobiales bacterium]|uniref:Glycine cleavage system H protein n=1 Tax=uncultured Thermomicrobiales bacterium TaxID=1645740 RepID=A0A6J4UUE9_9BACT|nr:MAG: Glycine cleavage system H protein [uncultured Thermomicrobiales bacterium]